MPTTPVSREKFLQSLRTSGLLSAKQFRKVLDQLHHIPRPRSIARALVEAGLLSKFQAELLLIGRTSGFFLGPYKILDQLGQGGMGRVYKAEHMAMKRTVALKVLAPHLMKTAKAQKLFKREVRAAAQLNHPNIVTAYDANEVEGRHYLAMEYVDGPNLDQLVRNWGSLPVGIACELTRQAALGLQAAHEQGMVHRDIKPANLLIQKRKNTQALQVKILDFGLARLQEPHPESTGQTIIAKENTVMGTPDFLSPEQARNLHQVDIRSDLYSLGCTLYFLLAGDVPYPGGATLEKLVRHGSEEPKPIEQFRQDVPKPVLDLLRKLMSKAPGDRYQTPQEVVEALTPFVAGTPAFSWQDRPFRADSSLAEATPAPMEGQAGSSVDIVNETMPAGFAPTPMSSDMSSISWSGDSRQRRPVRKALWWALGAAVGLASLIFLLLK